MYKDNVQKLTKGINHLPKKSYLSKLIVQILHHKYCTCTNIWSVLFLTVNESDVDVVAGYALTIDNAPVLLNLSQHSCNDLEFLCARILKAANPSTDFTITTGYTACTRVECIGVRLTDVIVGESMEPEDGFPLRELVNGSQTVRLDVTLIPDPTAGGVSGTDLWDIDVFFSNSPECSTERDYSGRVDLTMEHEVLPIIPGENATFAGINVSMIICPV